MKATFSFLALGLTAAAVAQTTPSPTASASVHLDEFQVSTHPYARSQTEIAQPTSVLGGAELDQLQALNLGDLLSQEPGVSSTYFGPGAGRPVIRGLSGPRVAVLSNGTATIDASSLSPDHAVSLDPLLIERVEVTRGPAALLQGGSAIGGAVNVVTHRIHSSLPPAGVHGRIEGRLDSAADEESGGIVLEGATGSLAWHADAFTRRTGDIDIPGFAESKYQRALEAAEEDDHDDHDHDDEDHEDEDHDDEDHEDEEEAFGTLANSFVESSGGAFGLSWIGESGYIGASFSRFDTRYGVPSGAHEHDHDHAEEDDHDEEDHDHEDEDHDEEEHDEEEEYVSIDLRQQRFELEGEWREPFTGWTALRWHAAWADYEHTEFESDEVGTVFTNDGFDLRVDALHEPWGGWQGALAVAWSASDFNAVGEEAFVPPTDTTIRSFMVFEEREIGATIWQLSGRLDQQTIDVTDGSGRDHDGTGWAASLGTVHEFAPGWSIATSASLTQRLPIAQELYADGPHIGTSAYEVGDPTLDAEESQGLDLSLRRQGSVFSGEVTAFYNHFDGYIYENPTGAEEDELPVYVFAQHDARFYGAEADGILHLHQDEHGHLDLTFGVDFVHATNLTTDTYLPRIPPVRWRTGLDWEKGPWRAGSEIVFAEGQDRLAPDEIPTDAYELWSAYAGYRFTVRSTTWDFLLRGTNLTDSEARLHTSFLKDVAPLPGCNVTFSVRMSF